MKIAIVCANGKAGQLIVKEAMGRGMDVTAVMRGENKTAAQDVIVKDLFNLTKEDLADFDAVVDAFGAWTEDTLPQHSTSLTCATCFLAPIPVCSSSAARAACS